jgi:NO-binding membrane sensor protein with MHYT domain
MAPRGLALPTAYIYLLVVLSVLISILAAWAALDLAGRVAAARGGVRRAWLIGGATASGIGTCSMHFTGMRAFRLAVPVEYDWPTVLISLLPALFASAVAILAVSRRNIGGATWLTLAPTIRDSPRW